MSGPPVRRVLARDLRPGDLLLRLTGQVVRIVGRREVHGGVELEVLGLRATDTPRNRSVLWHWPQQGVEVVVEHARQRPGYGPGGALGAGPASGASGAPSDAPAAPPRPKGRAVIVQPAGEGGDTMPEETRTPEQDAEYQRLRELPLDELIKLAKEAKTEALALQAQARAFLARREAAERGG